MPQMSGGDAVIGALLAHGIKTIYCLPGIQNDHLFNAMFDVGDALEVVHARHEQGSAYMALGAALATGKPQVFSVVPGPGFLNASTALATAYSTGAPVLALIGQIPSKFIGRGHGLLHEIPGQLNILKTLTKWAERIEAPQDAPAKVHEAFRQLRTGRPRPVGLEIAPDILQARADIDLEQPRPIETKSELDDDAIEQAAKLLQNAERPLIFVGGGAMDASAEVRALAERLGAPVVTYRRGKGVMDDRHPLAQSLPGGHALWATADVVLAVGTRIQQPVALWGVDDKLTIIKVDIDPEEIDRTANPQIGIVGDAARVLARLNDHLRHLTGPRPDRVERSRALKETIAKKLSVLEPQGAYLRAIRDAMPENGVLVEELTQVGYVSRLLYPVYQPRTFITSGYQGTLGSGFPTALGAKVAHPDRPVVAITGDGGFMFGVQELATAVQFNIGVVTLVFNNNAYGNVRRDQRERFDGRVVASDLVNPDFVKLAESFGVGAARVTSPETFRPALEKALAHGGPYLIAVEVPRDSETSPWAFIHPPKP